MFHIGGFERLLDEYWDDSLKIIFFNIPQWSEVQNAFVEVGSDYKTFVSIDLWLQILEYSQVNPLNFHYNTQASHYERRSFRGEKLIC